MTVGNAADAALAVAENAANSYDLVLSCQGTTRSVYLINGVVYKVQDCEYANEEEYNTITTFRDVLPEGVFFPDVSLFNVKGEPVIAMQYIEGQPMARCYCTADEECDIDCAPEDIADLMDSFNLDSGGMNVIHNESGYWIIDAA